jgi:hypothetical protein
MVAKNALSGLDSAKQVQFQVIAQNASGTSPAVIKGFQAVFNPINDEAYG